MCCTLVNRTCIDNIVNTSSDPVEAVLVPTSSISGEVGAWVDVHIGIEESLVISKNGSSDRWPGSLDRQDSLDCITLDLFSGLRIQDHGLDTEEGQSGRSWLCFVSARKSSDDDRTGLGLEKTVQLGTYVSS
jgi:hypothetical protein